ncbi:peptidoglycan-binding domain-containing protein [Streptomyces youssoufiensis]
MTGELCPHCFAPPRADGRPGCACAARGADLPDLATTAALPETPGTGPNPDDLRLFDDDPRDADQADADSAAAGGAAGGATGATPAGGAGHGDAPSGDGAGARAGAGDRPARHRRRRPLAIVTATAVLVAVVGTVAFGTGLLGGQNGEGSDDRALTDDRAATPSAALPTWDGRMTDGATPPPSTTATPSPSASRSGGESPSATPSSATPSRTREPSASPSAPSARPSETGAPDRPSESPTPSTSAPADPPRPTEPAGPPVLRQGDSGAEVAELQDRLRQTWTYVGAVDGEYDASVTDAVGTYQRRHDITADPEGVYGPHTRDYLEARTDQP